MKDFKPMRELINALLVIAKSIRDVNSDNESNKYIYPDKNIVIYINLSDEIATLYYFIYNTVEEYINFRSNNPDISMCFTGSLYNNNNLDISKCFTVIDWWGFQLMPPTDNPMFKRFQDVMFDQNYILNYDTELEITEETYYDYEGLINEIEGYYFVTPF